MPSLKAKKRPASKKPAARKGAPKARAVFLDRDGVVVEEVDYLTKPEQLALIPGVPASIAVLRRAGFKVVLATNQSVVGRGWLTLKGLAEVHRRLKGMLRERGAALDAIYFCPHRPPAPGKRGCRCRKPETGMLTAAARRFGLDLSRSYLVGDSTKDIMTAKRAGCTGILVETGKAGEDHSYRVRASAYCRDLPDAARWILRREGR